MRMKSYVIAMGMFHINSAAFSACMSFLFGLVVVFMGLVLHSVAVYFLPT